MGKREPTRRAKVLGILRDALRQKSIGIIEEVPEKGIVKYAKPAGVIASLIPVTSPYVTPLTIAIYAIKCRDAVIFSPHPGSRKTTRTRSGTRPTTSGSWSTRGARIRSPPTAAFHAKQHRVASDR